MKNVLLSLQRYQDVYSRLPFFQERSRNEFSFRVAILPYIGEKDLAEELKRQMKENSKLSWRDLIKTEFSEKMPKLFGTKKTVSDLVAVNTNGIAKLSSVRDGTENTIALIQMPNDRDWTEPFCVTPEEVVNYFDSLEQNSKVLVGFFNGTVKMLPANIDRDKLRSLCIYNDGKPKRRK